MTLPPLHKAVPNQIKGRETCPVSWPFSYGLVPNFSQWKVGDVVLMEATGSSAIVSFAQSQHPDAAVQAHQNWTHCALYIGEGLIIDARLWKTATIRRLAPETLVRSLKVRRLRDDIASADEAKLMAECAAEQEGAAYMYAPAGYALLHSGNYPPLNGPAAYGLVCSSLIEYAGNLAGVPLGKAPNVVPPLVPASFMVHPWFVDVPTTWSTPR